MRSSRAIDLRSGWLVAAAVATVLLGASAGIAGSEGDPNRVDKTSRKSFSDTLKAVEKAIESDGMMIVARIDHKNMLSMVGARIGGATTIEFGKPDMGKMLLPMNPAIGLEMPARIYVYESGDGKTILSFRKMQLQFDAYGSPEVANAGGMMDMMLDKITSAAAQ